MGDSKDQKDIETKILEEIKEFMDDSMSLIEDYLPSEYHFDELEKVHDNENIYDLTVNIYIDKSLEYNLDFRYKDSAWHSVDWAGDIGAKLYNGFSNDDVVALLLQYTVKMFQSLSDDYKASLRSLKLGLEEEISRF